MAVQGGIEDITLAVADNKLWFGVGEPRAARWDLPWEELFGQPWFRGAGRIRLLGTQANAGLICRLWETKIKTDDPYIVQLASPNFSLRGDIAEIFRQMLAWEYPPSVGGWHTMTAADYTTYALMNELLRGGGRMTSTARLYYKAHPAYPALSFIPTINDRAAALLLAEIGDPRFHVDPVHPDRASRLRAFLGISSRKNAQNYIRGRPADAQARSWFLFDAWASELLQMQKANKIEARDFLYRASRMARGGDAATALLRGSKVFVKFLTAIWLDRLTAQRQYCRTSIKKPPRLQRCLSYCPTLFVPEYFFVNPDEVEAWGVHLRLLPEDD